MDHEVLDSIPGFGICKLKIYSRVRERPKLSLQYVKLSLNQIELRHEQIEIRLHYNNFLVGCKPRLRLTYVAQNGLGCIIMSPPAYCCIVCSVSQIFFGQFHQQTGHVRAIVCDTR